MRPGRAFILDPFLPILLATHDRRRLERIKLALPLPSQFQNLRLIPRPCLEQVPALSSFPPASSALRPSSVPDGPQARSPLLRSVNPLVNIIARLVMSLPIGSLTNI